MLPPLIRDFDLHVLKMPSSKRRSTSARNSLLIYFFLSSEEFSFMLRYSFCFKAFNVEKIIFIWHLLQNVTRESGSKSIHTMRKELHRYNRLICMSNIDFP